MLEGRPRWRPRLHGRDGARPSIHASSFPFLHLFGKRALGAIGIILQTKIFVNLKQSLLLRDGFREARPACVAAEEPCGACLQSSIRQPRRQLFVGGPNVAAFGEKERQKHVREDLRDSRFADDRHFFRRDLRSERVVEIPKRVTQAREKIFGALRIFPDERPEKRRPFLRKRGERAEPALRMIERTRAAEPPDFRGQDESLHLVTMRPPAVPKFSHIRARLLWIDGEVRRFEKSGDAEEHRFDVAVFFAKERKRQPLRQKGEREFVLFVTERSRDLLEERGVAAVGVDEVL